MNEQKLNKLFAAARKESTPAAPEHFPDDVLRAIRREQLILPPEASLVFDQLDRLFPRLAWVAALVIVLGVATDFGLTAAGVPGLGDGVAQISTQWLFTGTGF
jgi:hypothetical protein